MQTCKKCGLGRGHKVTCPLRPKAPELSAAELAAPFPLRPKAPAIPHSAASRYRPTIVPPSLVDNSHTSPDPPFSLFTQIVIWILNMFPHVTILREGGRPYLTRWCLLGGSPDDTNHPFLPFNLFVHCFHASDDTPPHNHPWPWGRARLLAGIYREHRLLNAPALLAGSEMPVWLSLTFRAGDVNRIDDRMFHHVDLVTPRVWTLFLCPRKDATRKWGFLVRDLAGRCRFERARDHLSKKPGASSNERTIDG